MKIGNMLVVIDPTSEDQQPCLQRAVQLAERNPGARITLFMCDYNAALDGGLLFDTPGLEKARASLINHRNQYLDRLAKPLREKGLQVDTEAVWGKRVDRHILRAVVQHNPDLVLKTTHHHNLIKRLLLTNTDWQLIRHCEKPLWLVKQAEQTIGKLCASVDPLHEADKPAALDIKLINTARELAGQLGAEAHVVHCYNPLPRTLVFDASVITDYDGYAEDVRKRHAQAFDQLGEQQQLSADQRHLLQGYPEEVIPEFIKQQDINLLVMGAVSRSRLDSALIGHTAERLLDEADCDVLVIKPDDFRDPSRPD
ncbi:MAG: universal stress protein [Halopseudomonas yangmingensis]